MGALPGYPASHGCIRLPAKSARRLYASVPIGTLVEIR
jgi:lipoprotein-anchoring transpeptidase ErfK/SrfK